MKTTVLITGAHGNLGQKCVSKALSFGFHVRCFDLDNAANRKIAERYNTNPDVELVFGDITDNDLIPFLVEGVDAVIHNASLLPPLTDQLPELAEKINVVATKVLINECAKQIKPPVFIFPSSVTVFGKSSIEDPEKTASSPVQATDNYTNHKLQVETYLNGCKLPFVILRVGVSVDERTVAADRTTLKTLFAVHPDNPLEYVHPDDVAYAMCAAVRNKEAIGKILLIGGGQGCQLSQYQFLSVLFGALGLTLPKEVLGTNLYYTHWMNTQESQRILNFQHIGLETYVQSLANKLRVIRWLLTPLRPLIQILLPWILKRL